VAIQAAPIYRKWWFWTIIGAAVVGAATAAAVVTAKPGSGPNGSAATVQF
jgi:hypothetical protein